MAPSESEINAWNKYLKETRGLTGKRYEEVETWAWAQLQNRLRARARRLAKKDQMVKTSA